MANTGGEAGLFRLLEELKEDKADVVLLQEIAQTAKGCRDLTLQAAGLGYATYPMEGYNYTARWGNQQSKGGTAILVKKTLNHTPGAQERLRKASAQTVQVGDCIIGTGYAPPHEGPQEDLAQIISEIAQVEKWRPEGEHPAGSPLAPAGHPW